MLTARQLASILSKQQGIPIERAKDLLNHHRRIGMTGSEGRPGRGRPLRFGPKDLIACTIRFEFAALGMTPKLLQAVLEPTMPAVLLGVAHVVAGSHGGRTLVAIDGTATCCDPSTVVRWSQGAGSTRSTALVNALAMLRDLREAVATTAEIECGQVLEEIETWAHAAAYSGNA